MTTYLSPDEAGHQPSCRSTFYLWTVGTQFPLQPVVWMSRWRIYRPLGQTLWFQALFRAFCIRGKGRLLSWNLRQNGTTECQYLGLEKRNKIHGVGRLEMVWYPGQPSVLTAGSHGQVSNADPTRGFVGCRRAWLPEISGGRRDGEWGRKSRRRRDAFWLMSIRSACGFRRNIMRFFLVFF